MSFVLLFVILINELLWVVLVSSCRRMIIGALGKKYVEKNLRIICARGKKDLRWKQKRQAKKLLYG